MISKNLFMYVLFFILVSITSNCLLSEDINITKQTKNLNYRGPFQFIGKNAYTHVEKQLQFGHRIPGTIASEKASLYISDVMKESYWHVEFQDFIHDGVAIRNIIAKNDSLNPKIILGTHYDTRKFSDQESEDKKKNLPVPGANDGASGTSVLLELGRIIPPDMSIWLVFFDAEDQGNINGWDWSVGSRYFVNHLEFLPKSVVIIDMIGDKDLKIFREKNSDEVISNQIWTIAEELGNDKVFIDQEKYAMIDDHLPFIEKGIPASLIIDFDYPYWHTIEDTLDKISPESLQSVGDVLVRWLTEQ